MIAANPGNTVQRIGTSQLWTPTCMIQYNDVTWILWHLKWSAIGLFLQRLTQANIKRNSKAPHDWPLNPIPVDSPHKRAMMRKTCSYYDVIRITHQNLHYLAPLSSQRKIVYFVIVFCDLRSSKSHNRWYLNLPIDLPSVYIVWSDCAEWLLTGG